MLLSRVLTAAVLIPLVLLAIFKLSNPFFMVIWGAIILAGSWEWSNLSSLNSSSSRLSYVAFLAVLMMSLGFSLESVLFQEVILWVAFLWWTAISVSLFLIPERLLAIENKVGQKLLIGLVVLLPAWLALGSIHAMENGKAMVVYFLFLIWIADSGAYFAGRAFGKNKLAPKLSPGKTWEGVMGALGATALYACLFGIFSDSVEINLFAFVLISIITVSYSVCGDLFESLAKRKRGIKDSGSILPGHGGILDRIDSLLCAAPVFLLGIILAGF